MSAAAAGDEGAGDEAPDGCVPLGDGLAELVSVDDDPDLLQAPRMDRSSTAVIVSIHAFFLNRMRKTLHSNEFKRSLVNSS